MWQVLRLLFVFMVGGVAEEAAEGVEEIEDDGEDAAKGRPKDPVWQHFKSSKDRHAKTRRYRATCKYCDKDMDGKPEEMWRHLLVKCFKISRRQCKQLMARKWQVDSTLCGMLLICAAPCWTPPTARSRLRLRVGLGTQLPATWDLQGSLQCIDEQG
jgi:hypothetical protein